MSNIQHTHHTFVVPSEKQVINILNSGGNISLNKLAQPKTVIKSLTKLAKFKGFGHVIHLGPDNPDVTQVNSSRTTIQQII